MKTIKIDVNEFSFYCSPMPFSFFDPDGTLLREYMDNKVSWVVILASLQEIVGKCSRDLLLAYQEAHINTLFFPFNDYLVPEKAEQVRLIVKSIGEMIKEGRGVVIHCLSGVGRTGVMVGLVIKSMLSCSGEGAIEKVKRAIPGGIEGIEQEEFIRGFEV